jgi:CheY-like chemotaxis protein
MESTMSAEETGSASEPMPQRYPRSVLVVDDDPSVRTLLQMVLQVEGFDVRCASDGASAYEMIAASCPDVLLVDVLMPGLDGRGLTRRLREDPATAGLPIVICSALTDDRDQWAAWASSRTSTPRPWPAPPDRWSWAPPPTTKDRPSRTGPRVRRLGLEPRTCRLRAGCSAN